MGNRDTTLTRHWLTRTYTIFKKHWRLGVVVLRALRRWLRVMFLEIRSQSTRSEPCIPSPRIATVNRRRYRCLAPWRWEVARIRRMSAVNLNTIAPLGIQTPESGCFAATVRSFSSGATRVGTSVLCGQGTVPTSNSNQTLHNPADHVPIPTQFTAHLADIRRRSRGDLPSARIRASMLS